MRFTTRGIGWLIFGLVVCCSATEANGFIEKMSTIVLGLVFVAVYVIKQFFDPRRIGWFIAGGVLLAFTVEEGINSDGLFSILLAAVFLFIFYYNNREILNAMMNGESIDEYVEYDEYVDDGRGYPGNGDYRGDYGSGDSFAGEYVPGEPMSGEYIPGEPMDGDYIPRDPMSGDDGYGGTAGSGAQDENFGRNETSWDGQDGDGTMYGGQTSGAGEDVEFEMDMNDGSD